MEKKNKLLLIGALLLLFPLCTYLAVFFVKFSEDFVLIRFFLHFITVGERFGPVPYTYSNAATYVAVIVIAAMLFAHDFGKTVNRVLSAVGIGLGFIHLLLLLRTALRILSLDFFLDSFGMFCYFLWSHGLLFGLFGYVLLLVGFRKFLVKRKLKPWEEVAVL